MYIFNYIYQYRQSLIAIFMSNVVCRVQTHTLKHKIHKMVTEMCCDLLRHRQNYYTDPAPLSFIMRVIMICIHTQEQENLVAQIKIIKI
jgi:hypothetical protein